MRFAEFEWIGCFELRQGCKIVENAQCKGGPFQDICPPRGFRGVMESKFHLCGNLITFFFDGVEVISPVPPGIDATFQWAHPQDPIFLQQQRNTCAGHLVGSGAVQNHLPPLQNLGDG